MNKKWFVIVAIGIVAVVVVGSLVLGRGTEPGPSGNSSQIPPDTTGAAYYDVSVGEDFEISPGIVLDRVVAPAYFEFGEVVPGAIIDTWTVGGMVEIGKERIGYARGETLWLLLYNGLDTPSTFELQCINAPRDVNPSSCTGKEYLKAPVGFLGSITTPNLVEVQPFSCRKVPISIKLPVGLVYPDQWEFRILVTDAKASGLVSTGLEIRFFYTMRK